MNTKVVQFIPKIANIFRCSIASLAILLMANCASFAQMPNPVKWVFEVLPAERPNEYILSFTAHVDNDWNIYSQNMEDGGPVPTSFTFDEVSPSCVLEEGKLHEIGDLKEGYDKVFEMVIRKYGHSVTFQKHLTLTGKSGTVSGSVRYMTCDSSICLPPKDVSFSFNVAPAN